MKKGIETKMLVSKGPYKCGYLQPSENATRWGLKGVASGTERGSGVGGKGLTGGPRKGWKGRVTPPYIYGTAGKKSNRQTRGDLKRIGNKDRGGPRKSEQKD